MIRLNKLYIKGFKDPDREINIEFSKEPISVIYGSNGSGKTTLLKVISAIFRKDYNYLIYEKIKEINLEYIKNNEIKEIHFYVNDEMNVDDYEQIENIIDLTDSTSILTGIYRGIDSSNPESSLLYKFITRINEAFRKGEIEIINNKNNLKDDLYRISRSIDNVWYINDNISKEPHLFVNYYKVDILTDHIKKNFIKGNNQTIEKIKQASLETIANAVEIELNQEEQFNLPDNFWQRLSTKKDFLLKTIEDSEKSYFKDNLLAILEKGKTDNGILKSKIFRAFLINILEKAEEENIELKSVTKLMEVFNDHLYRDKKLVVTENEIYVDLGNTRRHELEDLSSGERHLLSFLTLFLIIGRGRDFFLIDEPEISLHTKWQRELLPLLSELSPESQIIAATHSPSIANRNTNYIVELK